MRLLRSVLTSVLLAACGGGAAPGPAGTGGAGGGDAAPALRAEAGFIEVPQGGVGANWRARMFFSFRPAEVDGAPLLVFFNGGPGTPTSRLLMSYGTGPMTLDPEANVSSGPVENPHSWTRFANLLYLDERMAGFSYGLRSTRGDPPCIEDRHTHLQDAADFVYALLEFLDTHSQLTDREVVLVGESYGGTRAALMLHLLHHHAAEPDPPIVGMGSLRPRVPWLEERVRDHYGGARTPDEVAVQFGSMVLIQPDFAGEHQSAISGPLADADPDVGGDLDGRDDYDVRQRDDFSSMLKHRAVESLLDPDRLEMLLGVSLGEVRGLGAADREDAFRWRDGEGAAHGDDLTAALGDLGPGDTYYMARQLACHRSLADFGEANAFVSVLGRSDVLITNARWDRVVYTEALPAVFASMGVTITLDSSAPAGAARPGVLHVVAADLSTSIRFPTYDAGHAVTVTAGRELGEDVAAWLAERR